MVRAVQQKNTVYGALNPAVSNVVFTHGQLDPWRSMGIQKDLNRNVQAIVIPGKNNNQWINLFPNVNGILLLVVCVCVL